MLTIKFIDGLVFSIISIIVVLCIIGLIILCIQPLKKISQKNKTDAIIEKKTKMSDDMVIALLIASIDFRETEKKTPKLLSIKEITYENL